MPMSIVHSMQHLYCPERTSTYLAKSYVFKERLKLLQLYRTGNGDRPTANSRSSDHHQRRPDGRLYFYHY